MLLRRSFTRRIDTTVTPRRGLRLRPTLRRICITPTAGPPPRTRLLIGGLLTCFVAQFSVSADLWPQARRALKLSDCLFGRRDLLANILNATPTSANYSTSIHLPRENLAAIVSYVADVQPLVDVEAERSSSDDRVIQRGPE